MTISGLFAPIPVPFNKDESLALDKLETNLKRWLSQPLDGVVLPGSNSEAPYLSDDERLAVWQVCGQVFRDSGKIWLAGTGVERTPDTIRLTLKAAECGAAGTLVVPPHYYKKDMTHEVLLAHYRSLADASPIPVMIYNIPAFTGIDFELKTLIALAEHPNIIGMKDSSSNVLKMGQLLQARPDFIVFAGTGGALLPFLSIGAAGCISALSNVAAVPLKEIMNAFAACDLEKARRIQISIMEINFAVTGGYGVPGLKYAMDQTGFYGGPPRRPLLPVGEAARKHLDRLIADLKLA
ncbi:MAG: dihydrodipicolinate synthase family protein [Chloroflexi bacterium]|nr:dihydrodipicolinate synthase family protein [Chloroflexota bacterium]